MTFRFGLPDSPGVVRIRWIEPSATSVWRPLAPAAHQPYRLLASPGLQEHRTAIPEGGRGFGESRGPACAEIPHTHVTIP